MDGKTTQYYENGNIAIEKNYSKGHLEGKLMRYYIDGKIASEENYSNNELISGINYSHDGKKIKESSYTESNVFVTTVYDSVSAEKVKAIETLKGKEIRTTFFYPNNLKKVVSKNDMRLEREEFYRNDTLEKIKDYDDTELYYKDGYLFQKLFLNTRNNPLVPYQKNPNKRPYEIYDKSGNIIEAGTVNREGQVVDFIEYENGVKTRERKNDRYYEYYPSGKISAEMNLKTNIIFGYYEDGKMRAKYDKNTGAQVGYYPNGKIKEKGYVNEDSTKEIGVWYIYDEKGKLSIRENDVERKPTSEEKKKQDTFLLDLMNLKEL
jgi:antitoxin component YwqK of YwqJK toxin-antitoxin module